MFIMLGKLRGHDQNSGILAIYANFWECRNPDHNSAVHFWARMSYAGRNIYHLEQDLCGQAATDRYFGFGR